MSDKIRTSPNNGWNDKKYRENFDMAMGKKSPPKPERESPYNQINDYRKKQSEKKFIGSIEAEYIKIANKNGKVIEREEK